MQQQGICQDLIHYLQSAIGLLDVEQHLQLKQEILSLCDYLSDPIFRIAVFGPFNHGKSTLLNALLGSKTLPIDLIPTTGAAIYIRHGQEIQTQIVLNDGEVIQASGTDILKQYAVLDDQRRMRNDVTSIRVTYPHPFLQTGVEFLDLPGTNDREAQDNLVRDRLLTADLIVQVLDARKLMTLGEREHLRDWLLDREIKTIVFVVNFLNLLEPDEQKEVFQRLRFVAESFRADLPPGISNLYRVDALPALRARLKGDNAAAQISGLATFESALQTITVAQQEKLKIRLPRVSAIAVQLNPILQAKADAIQAQLAAEQKKDRAKIEIKQKAAKLIQQGFQASLSEFESWLYLPKLLNHYQCELATALRQGQFSTWETERLKPIATQYQQAIVQWINKACEFFQSSHPGEFKLIFPDAPQVVLPHPVATAKTADDSSLAPFALSTGIGWILGGPVGAAVVGGATYIISQVTGKEKSDRTAETLQAYDEAANDYLTHFNINAIAALRDYERQTKSILDFQATEEPLKATDAHQLHLLTHLMTALTEEINKLEQL